MNPIQVKARYTAAELAALGLEGLPGSKQKLHEKALREGWSFLESQGRGGVRREYEPPAAVMTAIQAKAAAQLVAQSECLPVAKDATALAARQAGTALAKADVKVESLDSRQRACADARCAMVGKVVELAVVMGKDKAVRYLVEAAKAKTLPEHLQALVPVANAKANAERGFSRATLYAWLSLYEQAETPSERLRLLAPGKPAKDLGVPDWAAAFLACYRRPQKPSVTEAYTGFSRSWGAAERPSIHQVRRWLDKLPATVLYKGRHTGAQLAAKLSYIERDWETHLLPNDAWVGDGHCMKLKVAHPDHGKPFRPEVTLVFDGHTRLAVGWSVSLSENTRAVSDAIRHAVQNVGLPAIYYSDNGAGQKNKHMDAPVTGILGRLGIHHETGIPGNPQGRGLVERGHWILLRLANSFATAITKTMDKETARKTLNAIESALTAQDKGKALSGEQKAALAKLPSWNQFLDALAEAVTWYNTAHEHSKLPKNPATGRPYTPQAYWDARLDPAAQVMLDADELKTLFKPMMERTIQRGTVTVAGKSYYHQALETYATGTKVLVAIDIHDPQWVTLHQVSGETICEAELHGNRRDAFPLSQLQEEREERAKRATKRLTDKLALVEAERRGTFQLEQDTGFVLEGFNPAPLMAVPTAQAVPVSVLERDTRESLASLRDSGDVLPQVVHAGPESDEQRYARWVRLDRAVSAGAVLSDMDERFWTGYRASSEYEAMRQFHEDFGLVIEG